MWNSCLILQPCLGIINEDDKGFPALIYTFFFPVTYASLLHLLVTVFLLHLAILSDNL